MRKKKNFFNILHVDEGSYDEEETKDDEPKQPKTAWWILILVFFTVALPRLYLLFFVGDPQNAYPGWYGDVYHHWQVAYLTKEIGIHHGFLRLWDLKGMEYFWGILHPVVLMILFWITGSLDIIIPRLLSVVSSAGGAVFLFLILRRYFNLQTAVAGILMYAFIPVTMFSDQLGMQEPLGLLFLFAGIYFWPKRPFIAGILIGIAGMERAEFWVFGIGLLLAIIILDKKFDRKALFLLGFGIISGFYMKVLLTYTNNAIYPIYWNFLASAKGEWFADVPITSRMIFAQWIGRAIFALAVCGIIWTAIKRSAYYLFFLLGFANILFIGFMFGFGAYIRGYLDRFWIDRLLAWPYAFCGVLIAIIFLYWLPARFKIFRQLHLGWVFVVFILLLSQLVWPFLNHYRTIASVGYESEKAFAKEVANYAAKFPDGRILFPENRPVAMYPMVRDYQFDVTRIVSQMYDPFFYAKGDPFDDWMDFRKELFDWFIKYDIKLLINTKNKDEYKKMIELESDVFIKVGEDQRRNFEVYQIKVPDQKVWGHKKIKGADEGKEKQDEQRLFNKEGE